VARKHLWAKAWSAADLAASLAGSDPLSNVVDEVATWWAIQYQKNCLVPTLRGLFDPDGPLGTNATDPHVYKIAAEAAASVTSSTQLTTTAVTETVTGLMGDAFENIAIVMMHSAVYKRAQQLNLITTETLEDQNIVIRRFMGFEVIVDDGCYSRAGTTDGTVYQTYFMGQGALAYGEGAPLNPAETYREPLKGQESLITRRHFLLHPGGVAWQVASVAGRTATAAEMADDTNWGLVGEHKNVPIVCLESN